MSRIGRTLKTKSLIHIICVFFLFAHISCLSAAFAIADDAQERAEKIKIAYLFHFSQFTEWSQKPPVFTYCVYEDVHFSERLQQAYAGKTLGISQIAVQNVNAQSNFDSCQLVYFPAKIPAEILLQLKQKPILTVGEQKNFFEQGIIYLFEDNQKIRFFINNSAAANVGLKINSQLLSLSKEPQS